MAGTRDIGHGVGVINIQQYILITPIMEKPGDSKSNPLEKLTLIMQACAQQTPIFLV